MSASATRAPYARERARQVAHRLPWLVDLYRFGRKPNWELPLWRDLVETRRATSFMRDRRADPGPDARGAVVALYRDDLFDAKLGMLLASALALEGLHPVVYAPTKRARRVARYSSAFGISDVVFADELELDPETARSIDERAAQLLAGPCDFASVKAWRSGDYQVGNHVLSTVIRLTFDGSPDLSVDGNRALLTSVVHDVLTNYARAEELLDRTKAAAVLVEEANYSVNGPLVDVAVARGIDVVQTIAIWRDDALMSKRLTAENRREDAKSVSTVTYARLLEQPWTPEDERALDLDFERRYRRMWDFGRRFQPDIATVLGDDEIIEEVGLDRTKPTAVIFAHVLWDASLFFGVDLFANYSEWLVESVRRAIGNDRLNWVVKTHPSNVFRAAHGDVAECSELTLLKQSFTDLPPHVFVLRPDTRIATNALYRFADFGITVRGTPGLEMACYGKTVLTAGTGAYAGLGFTLDSTSRDQYLDRFDALEATPPPNAGAVERARRYAHALFVRRPWVSESFEMRFQFSDHGWNPLDRNLRLRVDDVDQFRAAPDLAPWRTWVTRSRDPDFFGPANAATRPTNAPTPT